jgi:hypothetical protein
MQMQIHVKSMNFIHIDRWYWSESGQHWQLLVHASWFKPASIWNPIWLLKPGIYVLFIEYAHVCKPDNCGHSHEISLLWFLSPGPNAASSTRICVDVFSDSSLCVDDPMKWQQKAFQTSRNMTEFNSICQLVRAIANREGVMPDLKRNMTTDHQLFINFPLFEWLVRTSVSYKSFFLLNLLLFPCYTANTIGICQFFILDSSFRGIDLSCSCLKSTNANQFQNHCLIMDTMARTDLHSIRISRFHKTSQGLWADHRARDPRFVLFIFVS